jgi:glycosyltransferase involved in cell wall biosynthesis
VKIGIVLVNSRIGGTEKRIANLFTHLSRRGRHEFALLLPTGLLALLCEQGVLRRDQKGLIPIFDTPPASLYNRLPPRLFGRPIRGFTRLLAPLWRRALRSGPMRELLGGFDLLHYALPTSYLLGALPFDTPMVVEAQDPRIEQMFWPFMEEARRRGAFFNFHSRRIREEYEASSGHRDALRFHDAPCSFIDYGPIHVGVKNIDVVFLGRLEREKNPLLFVQAMAKVLPSYPEARAMILGYGREERAVRGAVHAAGLSDKIAVEYHSRPVEMLSRARVFASLQPADNYGSQALLEAMACGCAIVASDVGQTREMVSPSEGRLVLLDADHIAGAVSALLDEPEAARRLGAAARDRVMREHTVERYAPYIELLYEKAAAVAR